MIAKVELDLISVKACLWKRRCIVKEIISALQTSTFKK